MNIQCKVCMQTSMWITSEVKCKEHGDIFPSRKSKYHFHFSQANQILFSINFVDSTYAKDTQSPFLF
ncbi:hypothetical protein R3W88_017470 [Solanum pinnatisectum]|uniref:Uncharacterized protein n=1 Tax=Solanum pinnatisectum TaxID=50273 RepID=A0AAV9L1E5_9SOLN|nr:hypothetical protein R3W88_017470 [Solanum pinnatisectum]